MRTQYCRQHIKKTAEECDLGDDIVSEVERVDKFCGSNPAFADCATRPVYRLISEKDVDVRNKAILFAENALNEETPTGGKVRTRLTEPEIIVFIRQAKRDLHGESAIEKPKKKEPYNATPQKDDFQTDEPAPPPVRVAALMKEKYGGKEHPAAKEIPVCPSMEKMHCDMESRRACEKSGKVPAFVTCPVTGTQPVPVTPVTTGQPIKPEHAVILSVAYCQAKKCEHLQPCKERGGRIECFPAGAEPRHMNECPIEKRKRIAQEQGFGTAADYDPTNGAKFIKHPPYKITKAPMTIHFEPSSKQQVFIETALKSGKFDTSEQVLSQALDLWMDQEGV